MTRAYFQTFKGDNDQNQFQTQQTHDVANETLAEQVDSENIASQLHNNNVYIMNKGEWTNEGKMYIINKRGRKVKTLYEEDKTTMGH